MSEDSEPTNAELDAQVIEMDKHAEAIRRRNEEKREVSPPGEPMPNVRRFPKERIRSSRAMSSHPTGRTILPLGRHMLAGGGRPHTQI